MRITHKTVLQAIEESVTGRRGFDPNERTAIPERLRDSYPGLQWQLARMDALDNKTNHPQLSFYQATRDAIAVDEFLQRRGIPADSVRYIDEFQHFVSMARQDEMSRAIETFGRTSDKTKVGLRKYVNIDLLPDKQIRPGVDYIVGARRYDEEGKPLSALHEILVNPREDEYLRRAWTLGEIASRFEEYWNAPSGGNSRIKVDYIRDLA